MNRRDFSLSAASLALASLSSTALAQAKPFKAGSDYAVLKRPATVDTPAGKVEVIEFFSYNCPHCAEFEPRLEAWVKQLPSYAVFRRVPVSFVGNDVETKQRLYYTLEALGKLDQFHSQLFVAIHQQRQRLFGDDAILEWASKQPGLDAKKFAEVFRSFSVTGKIKRATQLQNEYQIGGVPTLGVAGRWYVDTELARSLDRVLEVTSFLVTEARTKP